MKTSLIQATDGNLTGIQGECTTSRNCNNWEIPALPRECLDTNIIVTDAAMYSGGFPGRWRNMDYRNT